MFDPKYQPGENPLVPSHYIALWKQTVHVPGRFLNESTLTFIDTLSQLVLDARTYQKPLTNQKSKMF